MVFPYIYCSKTLFKLKYSMPPQRINDRLGKRDTPPALGSFWLSLDKANFSTLQRCPHPECTAIKIDISPPKRQQFSLTHTSRESENIERFQPLP